MSFVSRLYLAVFRGTKEWGEPPPPPPFAEFQERLDSVTAEYPPSLDHIPPDPELTPKQWKVLDDYVRWKKLAMLFPAGCGAGEEDWTCGADSYESQRQFWAGRVYNQYDGAEWHERLFAWKDRRRAIINSRRYATTRAWGVVGVLILALLPILSVLDFTLVAATDAYPGVVWSDSGIQDVRDFAGEIAWTVPWTEHDALGNEVEMTTAEKKAHTDTLIGLGALLFFPIAGLLALYCAGQTLWSAYDIGDQADKELTSMYGLGEEEYEAMHKGIDLALKRMFAWSVLGALFWWIPATIAAAIGLLIFLFVFGVIMTVAHSAKKVVTGKD